MLSGMMAFRVETVAQFWDELVTLARLHHEQYGIPWAFHVERSYYENLEKAGVLVVFTARSEAGELQGYQAFTVLRHPHYDCLMACQDTIYLKREARGFWSGKFLIWVERQLEHMDVQEIVRFVSMENDHSGSLERIGYRQRDKVLFRRV